MEKPERPTHTEHVWRGGVKMNLTPKSVGQKTGAVFLKGHDITHDQRKRKKLDMR